MASGTFSRRSNFRLDFNVWQGNQSVASNESTVHWDLWLVNTGGAWSGSQYTSKWRISVNSQESSGDFTFGLSGGQSQRLGGGSVQVRHRDDGTMSTGFSSSVNADVIGDASANGSMDLSTIARASQATFSPSEHTLIAGEPVTINMNRKSTSFDHVVAWHWGSRAQNIGAAADSLVWTPPFDFIQELPNALSGVGHIEVSTWQSGRWVGTTTSPFRVHVPIDKAQPKIKSVVASDDNPTVASAIGAFVQGESLLKVTLDSEGIMGASITSQWFSVDGQTAQSGKTVPLPNSGTRSIGVSVQESRGIITSESRSLNVLPYAPPSLSAVVQRAKSNGAVDADAGTYIRIDLAAVAQSLKVGDVEKNTLRVAVETRERGQTQWTARNVLNPTTLSYKVAVLVSGGGVYDVTKAYDVRVTVTDALRTGTRATTFETTLPTAEIFMDWSDGLGVLKYHEKGALDVGGEIYHRFGSLVDPVGIGMLWFTDTPPEGHLLLQGQAISRATYAGLFALFGLTFGAGNGSTTFNLPDMRQRVPVGKSADAEFNAIGKTGGSKFHRHDSGWLTAAIGAVEGRADWLGYMAVGVNAEGPTQTSAYTVRGTGTEGGTKNFNHHTRVTGDTDDASSLQPYITVNYIVKAV